jgi:hypothetical protein
MNGPWKASIKHVFREANSCADKLANASSKRNHLQYMSYFLLLTYCWVYPSRPAQLFWEFQAKF